MNKEQRRKKYEEIMKKLDEFDRLCAWRERMMRKGGK